MDKELQEVFAFLVSSPDRAELVEIADAQIQSYLVNPSVYIIPKAYKWSTPLVEQFAYDLEGWVAFVRELLNEFPKRSDVRMPLQVVYRKINVRLDAAVRRARLKRAVTKCEELYGPFDSPLEARDYERILFQYWKAAREIEIAKLQIAFGGKASAESKASLCDDYWLRVETAIAAGEIPNPQSVKELRDQAVKTLDLIRKQK